MAGSQTSAPSSARLRELFDAPSPLTVGLEEEVMVLDARTLDLAPRAAEVLERAGADERLKPELVAAQLEIASPPCATVDEAIGHLAAGRRLLAAAAGDELVLACAGAHPLAATEGPLTPGSRYEAIAAEYGIVARRQLCSALQVHVAVRGAERALAVYNALRSHLPDLLALSANAPYYDGADTGLASIRPTICTQLPRQGMPPAIPSWEAHADALAAVGDPGAWWWELRPHHVHGTLEIRVPDAQSSLADARAIAAFAHALVTWLAQRFDAGEELAAEESWRIEQRRWQAVRHGLQGPPGDRVAALLDELEEATGIALDGARALAGAGGGAVLQRTAAQGDVRTATAWLAARFLDDAAG